jgi:hypothetical protein
VTAPCQRAVGLGMLKDSEGCRVRVPRGVHRLRGFLVSRAQGVSPRRSGRQVAGSAQAAKARQQARSVRLRIAAHDRTAPEHNATQSVVMSSVLSLAFLSLPPPLTREPDPHRLP